MIFPELDCHLDVVGRLARSNEPESYVGWPQTKSNLPVVEACFAQG